MPRPLDADQLRDALHVRLEALGPASARELRDGLGISQPSFSRLVRGDGRVVKIGAGPATRYGLLRRGALPTTLPVYRLSAEARVERVAELVRLASDHLVVRVEGRAPVVVDDLPWFLEDLRPAGFLGRMVPRRNPDLGLPEDILLWTAEDVLSWLARRGWDVKGDLVVGDEALGHALDERAAVGVEERGTRYPEIAGDVLRHGAVGSSAGGEQPKFLVHREDADGAVVPVLVKFSPASDTPIARRVADLLVCEHLALETLSEGVLEAARSHVVQAGGRTFLEVERFDRQGALGRRGTVSLGTLDAEFSGVAGAWLPTVQALVRAGRVPASVEEEVATRAAFGELIGNADMHRYNLEFFTSGRLVGSGLVVTGLAPVFDMLPMSLAPRSNELVRHEVELPTPRPGRAWRRAFELAVRFWGRVQGSARVSEDMRGIAAVASQGLADQRRVLDRLPG